jgi:uncharacterized membrane protein YkoI
MSLDRLRIWVLLVFVCAAAVVQPNASAAEDRGHDCKRGQDCALGALKKGEIRPLSEVLAIVRAKIPGEIVEIELDREDGIWVYEIKILTSSGRRRKVEVNAQTLAIIKID